MNKSGKHYTPDEKAGIIAMRTNGKTAKEIAEAYGRTQAAINNFFYTIGLTDKEADKHNTVKRAVKHNTVVLDEKAFNDFLSKAQMTRADASVAIYEPTNFWSKVFRNHDGEVSLGKIDYLISKTGGDPEKVLPTLLKKETPKAEPCDERACVEESQIDLNAKLDELGRAVLLLHEDLQKIYEMLK